MAERQTASEARFREAEETIELIVRKKFRVSLSPADGRQENQNAIELCQQIKLLFWDKLTSSEDEQIRDARGYAAALAYHQCSQRRRALSPAWHSLKNRLRYFCNVNPGYAVWENEAGALLCGFAAWQHQPANPAAPDVLETLQSAAWSVLPAALHGVDLRLLKRPDWEGLLEAAFQHLEAPVELDELVTILADAFAVEETKEVSTTGDGEDPDSGARHQEFADTQATPEEALRQRQYLRALWQEICQLRPQQRLAYLLNFRDGDGDLHIFALNGVATLAQIGRILQISDEQFECLWRELPMDEATRREYKRLSTYDEKFAALSLHIPLEDLLIASLLGGKRQQVINLRRLTRDRLSNRLRALR